MNNLKKLRELHGISQNVVANLLGLARNSYTNLENENRQLSPEYLRILADYFNVSVDCILGREEIPDDKKPAAQGNGPDSEISQIYLSLSPDNRAKLLELAHLYQDAERKNAETE